MSTKELLDEAAAAYQRRDWKAAVAAMDAAKAAPDAADHVARIRTGNDLLVLAGARDQVWVPAVPNYRRCPATESACPYADTECTFACGLEEGGWPVIRETEVGDQYAMFA